MNNNMNHRQGAALSNQFLTMPQLPSPATNNSNNKMVFSKAQQQQWNTNVNNNMNFPVLPFDTSLLGMAAASIFTEKPMFLQQQQQQQQMERADARAITSQVLAELADDSLFDGSSPVSEDIFDLEPVPLAENLPQGQVVLQQQQQRSSHPQQASNRSNTATSRLALLEDTLNQVLSDESDFFALQGPNNTPPAPLSAPNMLNHPFNNVKRTHQETTTTALSSPQLASSPFKKQRTSAVVAGPAMHHHNHQDSSALANGVMDAAVDDEDKGERFRDYQSKQWSEKFQELMEFKQERGHCCVPHTFKENPPLARWVKRQRYQYKLKNEQKPSTMTERILALERMGFVWDSHGAAWEERWSELRHYQGTMGHCNVPSNYNSNPQLATWVKCQRRQYKLFWDGKPSNMTLERISKLETLGFEWELRGPKKNSSNNNKAGGDTTAAPVANNNNNWSL